MKILLIDDHELVRYAIGNLLKDLVHGAVIVEASSLARGSRAYSEMEGGADLVVLDLNLPDSRGLAGVGRFMRQHPQARLVVLSGSVDEAIAAEAASMGAMAFLHKTSDIQSLRSRMLEVLAKVGAAADPAAPGPRGPAPRVWAGRDLGLNARELKVLDLVLQGHNNREIAEEMNIATGTVKNHISGLLAAFGVTSRARLIALFH
ncbi:response regulator transcription factor [Ramlibacter humi]|uniref:Response regulator transcription factor n=1 Tax=Ramlibacter humi TaxID=2530451 RepID=A0A4Z0BPW1_9BURK|nr:response regulator transcription factor [Ramlibacter humi]TFZ00278.1 response regulator transcription factor [Ramlibacter humi]